MDTINVQLTAWSVLPDASEVKGVGELDAACLRELRDVLLKHKALERFGISLLHKHYEIENDEMLLETTDVIERTQFIRPVKIKDYLGREDISFMATCFKLIEGDAVAVIQCGCMRDKHGHSGRHG